MKKMTHLDEKGNARMVDISPKQPTQRAATAKGRITLGENAAGALANNSVPKGDVFAVARIGAIQAVKKTSETIPLCHPLRIGAVSVDIELIDRKATVTCTVTGIDSTGFEMEALVGVSTALLIIYDMTKSLDREMVISDIRLIHKAGGKSGEYKWEE
ncbi:MAG: cyclic pyranopterin monophosphate synthase MoaC [FCB group bacterium]|nr:cyclic pyranopterin monophosphate synthase MoaC [FCB group bacterium]